MKNIDRNKRNNILKNPYMTADDIYHVLPIGKNQAQKMFNEIYNQLIDEGITLFKSRPKTIPTKVFKERILKNGNNSNSRQKH